MVTKPQAGFREREHTADWALEVWAPDLPQLFEHAARGMYSLAGVTLVEDSSHSRPLELTAPDDESLLVAFLSELLYFGENEGLGFHQFDVHISGQRLTARLQGGPLASISKEIKAVTYHNLAIRKTRDGLKVEIVFDV